MSGGKLFNAVGNDEFDDEFDTKPEPDEEVSPGPDVDDLVDEVTAAEEEADELMDEADRRTSLGGYYKILARGGVFNDGTEEAAIVDQELKTFARERMRILLNLPGGGPAKVEFSPTEEQAEALLSMANRIIERQGGAPPTAAPAAVARPVAPVPVKPVGPKINPLPVPQALRRPPAAAPAKKPKAAPEPAKKPLKKSGKAHTPDNTPMGEVFEEKGKQYKFVPHPETGEPLKLNVSASKRVHNPHAIPMPSEHQYAAMSESMAAAAVNTNPAMKSQLLITAAALSAAQSGEE